jgi:hypothetical protein
MKRLPAIIPCLVAVGLVALAHAGPTTTRVASTSASSKPASTSSAAPAADTTASVGVDSPKIFLVWRGAPQSFSSGFTYVDAAGHELSRSREVALQKATQHALAAAQAQAAAKTAPSQ